MKNILLISFVTVLIFSMFGANQATQAAPMGVAQHPGGYFLGDEDLGRWMMGVYYLDRERDIRTLGSLTSLQTVKKMGYVGFEIIYGMSGYVILGSTQTQFEGMHITDTHSEFGFGLQFNILDHEIPDPTLMEDRVRINATLQYTKCGADWIATEVDWEEIYGSITVSFINDIEGNKYFHLNSIGFFFGAIYSDLISSSVDEESSFGYCAGVDLFLTEKTSLEFGTETLDSGSVFGAFHVGL